jgi:hypothetical protein
MSIPGAQISVFRVDGGQSIASSEIVDSVGVLYPGERVDILVGWEVNRESDSVLIISLDEE